MKGRMLGRRLKCNTMSNLAHLVEPISVPHGFSDGVLTPSAQAGMPT